jgi:DUF1680 family protein
MITYFLPLCPGGAKRWGSPTEDFWCCHGTLVQAHTLHDRAIYFRNEDGLAVAQYIPSECEWEDEGTRVLLRQTHDGQDGGTQNLTATTGPHHRPMVQMINLTVRCDRPCEFALALRIPWWVTGEARVLVNGQPQTPSPRPSTLVTIRRTWNQDTVRLELPRALTVCPLPDDPDRVAFMEGPLVLAGLCDEERALHGHSDRLQDLLAPDVEREWGNWKLRYRTIGQTRNIRFVPILDVTDEKYTVYLPLVGQ